MERLWVVGFFPAILILSLLYLVFSTEFLKTLKRHWKAVLVFGLCLGLFLNLYTIWHMSHEHFLYYWDFSGFWRRQLELMRLLQQNPGQVYPFILNTIRNEEYSSLPQLFLIPHILLIGDTYPRYILAMVNCTLIPSTVLFYVWMLHLIDQWDFDVPWVPLGIGIGLMFFTGNYLPLILGYEGAMGLYFIVFILFILSDFNVFRFSWHRNLVIGISLVFLVFIRRWYAYFAIGYFVMAFLPLFIEAVLKGRSRKSVFLLILNFFMMGLTALGVMVLGFLPLVQTYLTYDY